MKIGDAVARHNRSRPSVRDRVLAYVTEHPDEVFSYRDEELLSAVGTNKTGLNFALWSLGKSGAIDMYRVDSRVYFGTSQAIGRLKSSLGSDWIRRGSENARRIFERVGYINTRELLDEVRGPWD